MRCSLPREELCALTCNYSMALLNTLKRPLLFIHCCSTYQVHDSWWSTWRGSFCLHAVQLQASPTRLPSSPSPSTGDRAELTAA
ncbi:hypothetical protein DUNSADRAFT_2397 [Dunaliella salina]|uniref:Encoded protein n=1 Tax=Dunaliella salina TaxID=3046 RepID=A0ABQ7FWB5_DUNSA|nr:hypothetical protein DUNSADRAFT_2397 [Dunaliella salina]|eukprot:KAF5826668.1 hypothetical protein DUNSADRAFT_2397 [Dunaliella salina]